MNNNDWNDDLDNTKTSLDEFISDKTINDEEPVVLENLEKDAPAIDVEKIDEDDAEPESSPIYEAIVKEIIDNDYQDVIMNDDNEEFVEPKTVEQPLEIQPQEEPVKEETTVETPVEEPTNNEEETTGVIEVTGDENKPSDKKPKNKKAIIIILSTLCILALAALVGILLWKNNERKKANKVSSVQKESSVIQEKIDSIKGISQQPKEKTKQEIVEEETTTEEYKKYEELTDKEKEKIEVIPRKEEIPYEVIDDIKKNIDYDETEKLPKKFNLNDKIKLRVENQATFGLCWDFASMKTLETNAALKHNVDYDLSEIHLDYIESNLFYGYREVHTGGNFSTFKQYFIDSGAVDEKDAPYKDYKEEEYKELPNKKIVLEATETIDYPSISLEEKSDKSKTKKVEEFRNVVKTHLMKNGSLYATVATPDSDREFFDPETNAEYYNGNSELLNPGRELHAVAIVGWDDNYSKNNFATKKGEKPKNDGAYIALNSWDEMWGDNGYFYISYEDDYVERYLSGVVNTTLDTEGYVDLSTVKNSKLKKLIKDQVGNEIITKNDKQYISKIALEKIYGYDLSDIELTNDDIETINYFNIGYLDLSKSKITDFSKLNTNKIHYLDLVGNGLKNIDGLNPGNITGIDLSDNDIKDLSVLKDSNITYLNLNNNKNVDVSTIPDSVTDLYLTGCGLDDISKLKLNEIETLDLTDNNIKDMSSIKGFKNAFVYLNNNKGIDISTISGDISELSITDSDITSLEGFKLKSLDMLELNNNNISDVSPLAKALGEISHLDLSNNKITNVSELSNIKTSEYSVIFLNGNNISNISSLNNLNFESISVADNDIEDISTYNGKARYLNLSNNKKLTTITKLTDIYMLDLADCGIESINLDKEYEIEYLDLSNNDIKDVSFISKIKNLNSLSLAGNKNLTGSLKNSTIEELNLADCDITDFDFLELNNLSYLNLSNNKLSVEDLSNKVISKYKKIIINMEDYEIPYEEYYKLEELLKKQSNTLYGATVKMEMKAVDKKIDFSQERLFTSDIDWQYTYIENGSYDKVTNTLTVDDIKKEVTISPSYNYYDEDNLPLWADFIVIKVTK